jgi:hypothetical protein
MNILISIGICVGILASIWTGVCSNFQLITFAGFLSWASFYAAGGELKGLKDSLITNNIGVVWGFIIINLSSWLAPITGGEIGLMIAVGLIAAMMVWQAKIPLLHFIPGTFIGCSTFFATNFDVTGSIVGLVFGAFLGYISQSVGKYFSKPDVEEIHH